MKEKTFLDKVLVGLASGVASMSLMSCETPSKGESSTATQTVGKCSLHSCGARDKKGGCGSCEGKDKKSGCGSCGGKDKKSGCGEHKDVHERHRTKYQMMTKEDCDKKGGKGQAP